MRIEHAAIDGSRIVIEADADLSTEATATGWAIVPSLMKSHPFSLYPAGHSRGRESLVLSVLPDLKVGDREEYALKGGTLHLAEIRAPDPDGGTTTVTYGAWEGSERCLVTSLTGADRSGLAAVFDTLDFAESSRGFAINSPVLRLPRPPEVFKEIPGLGILGIRPAIPSQLERVPQAKGFATDRGELFRVRPERNALLFVSRSAVVDISPAQTAETREMLDVAATLSVEWVPRTRDAA